MSDFINQTIQEIASNNNYKNCTLRLYGDVQDLTNCKFENCKFHSEVVLIYGISNCSFTKCKFGELRIAKDIESTEISDCTIDHLNLETTKIVDKTFSFLKTNNTIEKLNLHWTDLQEIPKLVLELKTLKNLYLGNNYITDVSENIVQLFRLEVLDLSDNKITTLPQNFSQLENLEVLGLSGNDINQIPPNLSSMKKLSNLVLDSKNFTPEQQKVISEYIPSCSVYFD